MGGSQSVPDKNSFYQAKEHFADEFPVWTQEGFDLVKVYVSELFTSDPEALKKVGERVIKGLSEDNILILHNDTPSHSLITAAAKEVKSFLTQSQEQKEECSAEKENGKRLYYSGYSLIHFENRDNKRDQEWRDVFQIRFSELDHIPWPSTTFKSATTQLYESQWAICTQVMHALSLALNLNPLDLLALAGSSEEDYPKPNPLKSENTNLSLFHYFDKNMSYKTPQRCMVHRDHGLLTLLPKTDLPGLELLHPRLKQWIPIEQFIDENDILLYCGEALHEVTNKAVTPATHRVVRLPQKERFSMPFEMKPNNSALLRNLVRPENEPRPSTFEGLTKRLQWERIITQVNRADGIAPTDSAVAEQKEQPNFGQAHHDVQLPSVTVS
jgi:isopenicillin N synthase-like dioxygenase